MKADSGSWLYIILSIVFLVLSALGNKNKKKATTSTQPVNDEDDYEPVAPTQTQTPSRNWPKNLEDVLSEVLDVPRKPEVVFERPQPVSRETVLENTQNSYERIEEEAQSLETISDEIFTYETLGNDKKKTEHIESPITQVKTEEREPIFSVANMDLRQGIIYAEILNRKYF